MNEDKSTFTWNDYTYFLKGKKRIKYFKKNFIVGQGWQEPIKITSEEYSIIAKKYYDIFK
jgi:hypothetical protein